MSDQKPRLLILGTGFGAFRLLADLKPARFSIQVLSPRNHFLFTPLLPSTSVGTIEFRSIIEPVRRAHPEVEFILASARSVDPARREVLAEGPDGNNITLPYDRLVIAVGARTQTYGVPGVGENALLFKELADARAVRQRMVDCLEQAALPGLAEQEKRRLLHWVVVGGGPTGVELAAELYDVALEDFRRLYGRLAEDIQITLLEAGAHILNTFDASLMDYTLRLFQNRKIEVRTAAAVTGVENNGLSLKSGERIGFGLLVWAAGVRPVDFIAGLPWEKDKAGRLLTDSCLRVPGAEGVYALGDCAHPAGKEYPGTAQVAEQEGAYLARCFNAGEAAEARPFVLRNKGMLAYVGGDRAIADLSAFKGKGFAAWLFWRSVYLTKLVSLRNKIQVLFDWIKASVFGRDLSRF